MGSAPKTSVFRHFLLLEMAETTTFNKTEKLVNNNTRL